MATDRLIESIRRVDGLADADRARIIQALKAADPIGERARAVRARDETLRGLARQHFPHISARAASRQIALMAKRYEATSWRHDRHRVSLPEHLHGRPQAAIWAILADGLAVPTPETLRKIIQFGG